jgi:hypothetical protein
MPFNPNVIGMGRNALRQTQSTGQSHQNDYLAQDSSHRMFAA